MDARPRLRPVPAIGRALVGNPKLLLLDEPFEGLAPVLVDVLVSALVRLRTESRMATILVEQHVDIALELTQRAVVLDKGQVVWAGPSAALAADQTRPTCRTHCGEVVRKVIARSRRVRTMKKCTSLIQSHQQIVAREGLKRTWLRPQMERACPSPQFVSVTARAVRR